MMDNHHFPINNKIARYVLAVQCIGQVKFGLKIKDHSNHYHHLLQYQQVYTTAVLLLKIQKAQNTKTKATTTTTTTTTTMILTKTSNWPEPSLSYIRKAISAYLPHFQLWSSWWPPQTPGQQPWSSKSDQNNRQNLLLTLKLIFPLPSLSNSRNIWSIKTFAFLCSTNIRPS